MIVRRDSLSQALSQVEAEKLTGVSIVVVSRRWWDSLSVTEQSEYRSRAARSHLELRVDEAISSHFVEVRGKEEGPPLSTESPMSE
jgi:hypothetical protein